MLDAPFVCTTCWQQCSPLALGSSHTTGHQHQTPATDHVATSSTALDTPRRATPHHTLDPFSHSHPPAQLPATSHDRQVSKSRFLIGDQNTPKPRPVQSCMSARATTASICPPLSISSFCFLLFASAATLRNILCRTTDHALFPKIYHRLPRSHRVQRTTLAPASPLAPPTPTRQTSQRCSLSAVASPSSRARQQRRHSVPDIAQRHGEAATGPAHIPPPSAAPARVLAQLSPLTSRLASLVAN